MHWDCCYVIETFFAAYRHGHYWRPAREDIYPGWIVLELYITRVLSTTHWNICC